MEFSQGIRAMMDEALGMARADGFIFVGAAYNEHDGSIQFINNNGMSRMAVRKILESAVEVLADNGTRMTEKELPNLIIGEA